MSSHQSTDRSGRRRGSRKRSFAPTRWTRTQRRLVGIAVVVVVLIVVLVSSGKGYGGPRCAAHSQNCALSSNGIWIPLWYYSSLQQAQGLSAGSSQRNQAPDTSGVQPTAAEEEADGATPSEADAAESAASSSSSDNDDDGGGGDDDVGGDDGGGGGDDGG